MKKIPTMFVRSETDRSKVLPEVSPGCEWVAAGDGVATRKYDGTCCAISNGILYKRHEVKPGKAAPDGFELAQFDPATGKSVGWLRVGDGPEDRWHREAFAALGMMVDGTYELLGPKIQGNPEGFECHRLLCHADAEQLEDAPRTFDGLREYLSGLDIEGIVWHHPDGRMAKIKGRDFGIRRHTK